MAVVPSPDSAGFYIALHEGLFARQGRDEQGQQLADTSRAAAGQAMEAPPPPGQTPDIAALISPAELSGWPAGAVRIQRAAGVMRQFPGEPPGSMSLDAAGVSMTVTLWHFLIMLRAGGFWGKAVSWVLSGADRGARQRPEEKGDLMRNTWV